jgi:AraC-like DNA-binding protein
MNTEKKGDGFEKQLFFVVPDRFLAEYFKNPLAPHLAVTIMGYFPRAANHYVNRSNGSGTALMMYCCAGKGYYAVGGRPLKSLSAGQVVIFPPHTPHEYFASEDSPWSIYWVHFKGNSFYAIYDMIKEDMPIDIGNIIGDKFKEIFHQCFCILQFPYYEEEFLYLCQQIGTMLTLLPCVVRRSLVQLALNKGSPQQIQKALSYMQAHLHEEVTLAELADTAHFSPSHLYRLFKSSTGYAPIEFFLRTKIHAAAHDIYFSTLSVKDIAISYGIENPYYFSRLFRKIIGISPKKFRNCENTDAKAMFAGIHGRTLG